MVGEHIVGLCVRITLQAVAREEEESLEKEKVKKTAQTAPKEVVMGKDTVLKTCANFVAGSSSQGYNICLASLLFGCLFAQQVYDMFAQRLIGPAMHLFADVSIQLEARSQFVQPFVHAFSRITFSFMLAKIRLSIVSFKRAHK